MVDVYLALDCTFPMLANGDVSVNENKLKLATSFYSSLVEELVRGGGEEVLSIHLVHLGPEARVAKDRARNGSDVAKVFGRTCVVEGVPNFVSLRDLLLQRQLESRVRSKLIVAMNASSYQWIPDSFRLPCGVSFIAIAEDKSQLDARLLADFEAVSKRCGNHGRDAKPLLLHSTNCIASLVAAAVKIITGQRTVLLTITPEYSIKVSLTPCIPHQHPVGIHGEAIALSTDNSEKSASQECRLIGFVKGNTLLHLPSTSALHHVGAFVGGQGPENSLRDMELLAESMGQESQVGVFQHHPSGSICVLRPIREDAVVQQPLGGENNSRWQLCLQFIPTESFRFHFTQGAEAMSNSLNPTRMLAEERAASYRTISQRTYWTDPQGIQSDIMKLNRLLKKADRTELFRAEVQRIAHYAIACGYHSFAPTFADLLEQRCTAIADENRETLSSVLLTLRGGGFLALCKSKN